MKKKCLIIIPGIPFPPVDGHKLKIFNLIKILNKKYDLHLITISRTKPNPEEQNFIEMHSYKRAHFKISVLPVLFGLFKNFFSSVPFQVGYFTLPEVKRYLKEKTKSDELAVLNLIRTAGYLPNLPGKSIVFDMVDLLSKNYLKSSKTTSSFSYKIMYSIEGKRLFNYEKKVIGRSDLTLCVNNDDAKMMMPFGKVRWLPNGVNEKLFNYSGFDNQYDNAIVFFGAMFYQPNIDAVLWFDKNVVDYLNPKIKLYIIGARPSKQVLKILDRRKNVIITGFLDDPYLIINSSFAVVAPMQNGGGIQNKILETMAMGKVNVLSSYGALPILGANDKEHFFIEDDGASMANRINDIFANKTSYTRIGTAAKQLILNNYTWNSYEMNMMNELAELK